MLSIKSGDIIKNKGKAIVKVSASVILLVIVVQLLWSRVYPSFMSLYKYPTMEYLQIMSFLSPNGLSILFIILGLISIAWIIWIG